MKENILTTIALIILSAIVWFCGFVIGSAKQADKYKQRETINLVEFKATFKNYEIIDKYHNGNNYFIVLLNSYTKKETIVKIKDYEYYNIYFVGDIIE